MFTLVFGGTASKSISGTNAVRRTTERSMSCTIGIPGRTNVPGSPRRAAISPSNGARRRQSLTSSDLLEACARSAWICASFAAEPASFCSTSFGAREAAVEELAEPGRLARGRLLSCLERPGLVGDRQLAAEAFLQSSVARTAPRFAVAPGRTSTVSHESGGELRSDAGLLPRLQRAHVATRPAIADRLCRHDGDALRLVGERDLVHRALGSTDEPGAGEQRDGHEAHDDGGDEPSLRRNARVQSRCSAQSMRPVRHWISVSSSDLRRGACEDHARSRLLEAADASWMSASVRSACASATSVFVPSPTLKRRSASS